MLKNFERVDLIFYLMEKQTLHLLSTEDLLNYNGGHVPMAWYMDDSSIDANGSFISGFFSGLGRGLGLW